jgi:ribosomal protein L31
MLRVHPRCILDTVIIKPAVSADSNTSTPTGSTAKQRSAQLDVHLDTDTFFGAQQDDNDDGQVSEEEFVQEQGVRGAGEALSC